VIDRFIAEYVAVKAGPRSAYEMERLLRHDVIPAWGGRQIASITESDIETLLEKIVTRGSPMTANKVLSVLKTMFAWRPVRRLVGPSPCADIDKPVAEIPRDRVLSNDELRDAYIAAADPSLGSYGAIFRLLILTGKRKSEVAGMRWSELSLGDGTWLIPAGRAKTASEDLVQLSGPAREILLAQPREAGTDLVFHEGGKPLTSFSRAKASLDALMPAGTASFRIHDFRRTYATIVASLKRPPHVVEALLAHRSGVIRGVARTYNRYAYAEEKKLATAEFARFLLGLIQNRPILKTFT
jgi:integrase